ncbi:MAG: ABC transporter substrate-binding protein [Chloroflexi bacterium]|nr:ABC transporter substrate-binding protein [Chloroflexota bacterium]
MGDPLHPENLVSRRRLLLSGSSAAVVSVLAACSQPTPPAPPAAAPTQPSTSAAPAAPTQAPAAAGAPAPAGGVATPAAAQNQLGAQLVGKLEGATIVTDPAMMPTKFNEAPMLAQLVQAGQLPPVDQRLPSDPMVLQPLRDIGQYGGTWRRAFTGPADGENMNRIMSTDKLIFVDYTGVKIVPSLASAWNVSEDGKTITVTLRKGAKWSDGQPFNADDMVFWYQDLYSNKDLVPSGTPEFSVNGKPGTLEKIDDYTAAFKFEDAYPLFVDMLSGFTTIGAGFSLGSTQNGPFQGGYAPAHYLKQFHPKYTQQAQLDQAVAAAGLNTWVELIKLKQNYQLNPECPVMTPWRTVTPITTASWTLERNPYFWAVDTQGNQLPYIDKVSLTLVESLEVANLKAMAGELDEQTRHMDLTKLPAFLDNQPKGDYTVRLDPQAETAQTSLQVNLSYRDDPEVAKWLTNKDFRRALSLGIDRDQLNEAFFLGTGTPGSVAPASDAPDSPGPEWRTMWSTHDPQKANAMLDQIGLDKKDSDGYRLRTDGQGRLRIQITTVAASMLPWGQQMEMITQQWKAIGIQGDIKDTERSLAVTTAQNNQHHIYVWGAGTEDLFLFPRHEMPVEPTEPFTGPLYAQWYATNGASGEKPTDPDLLKALELLRSAAALQPDARLEVAKQIRQLIVDNQWVIGTVGMVPNVRIIRSNMKNEPERISWRSRCRTPGATHPSTYYLTA